MVYSDPAQEDDQSSTDTAIGNDQIDPSDEDESASSGDVADKSDEETDGESEPAETDQDDAPSDEDDESADDAEEPEKPRSRLQERLSQLSTQKRELERKLIEAETRKQMLEEGYSPSRREESAPKPKVDLSKYDPKKLAQAQEVFEALGLGDVKSEVQALKDELQRSKDEANRNADRSERQQALSKFKDIGVTEDEIVEQIEAWETDPNPRVRLRAQLPYEDIVRLMKADTIAQRDVDKSLKLRKKVGPRVDAPASKQGTKPAQKESRWNPGDPDGSMDSLKRRLLPSMMSDE